jgi:hypothetical protein
MVQGHEIARVGGDPHSTKLADAGERVAESATRGGRPRPSEADQVLVRAEESPLEGVTLDAEQLQDQLQGLSCFRGLIHGAER